MEALNETSRGCLFERVYDPTNVANCECACIHAYIHFFSTYVTMQLCYVGFPAKSSLLFMYWNMQNSYILLSCQNYTSKNSQYHTPLKRELFAIEFGGLSTFPVMIVMVVGIPFACRIFPIGSMGLVYFTPHLVDF